MDNSTQSQAVSSVLKVFSILQALSEQKEIGVTELSQRLMMSKATTYRFLQTMKNLGYVSQKSDEKYSLTLKLFEISSQALGFTELSSIADKEMRFIAEQTNEALHLGAMDEDSIIYIHKIDSSYNLRMQSRIGRRNPLNSTAIGKVLLAQYDNDTLRNILNTLHMVKSTEKTITDIEQLLIELSKVRQQHFAEDNEEQESGLRCIAVPIYDRLAHVIAGLSISLPSVRYEENRLAYYVDLLQNAAKNISSQLGFHHYPLNKMEHQ